MEFHRDYGKKDEEIKELKIRSMFERSYVENQTHINEKPSQEN